MGTIPVVPTFPAGTLTTSAGLNELCTAITWCLSGRPLCQLTKTATQSIPNSTQTAMQWGTKIVDRDSGWSSGANTEYTAQTPGIYKVAAFIPWAGTTVVGSRRLTFQVTTGSNNPAGSGLSTLFGTSSMASASGSLASCTLSKILTPYMYVGDFLQVMAWQDSGGALSTVNTSDFGAPIWTIGLVSG